MAKALKEEYVPSWWKEWRERDHSHQLEEASHIKTPVDIIAVQGLASTYEWTWTREQPDGSKSMWLRDFLPQDLPDARIMTFEYDSRWLQDPALVDLEACGDRLLESLVWDRTHQGSQHICPIMARRPLILLGHSFGGLVIKQALVTAAARRSEDHEAILSAIAGVMFLGTPHQGSAFADAAYLQAFIRRATGHATNMHLLKSIQVNSTVLAQLQQEYDYILKEEDRLSGLSSTYCYETKPLRLGPFETALVVEEVSACWGYRSKYDRIPLDANHMEMNKFGSRQESNYIRVMRRLSEVHSRATYTVEARLGKYQYLTQIPGGSVMQIRQWLSAETVFNTLFEKRQQDRLAGTCEWAGELDEIQNWAGLTTFPFGLPSSDRRFVWISGKAGSGKSVLAVWLFDKLSQIIQKHNWSATDVARCSGSAETMDCQHHTVTNNKAVLYFPISKTSTTASVVRTLVHQLLMFQPTRSELQDWVVMEKGTKEECTSDHGMRILAKLLRFFPVVYIIIDGLDECNNPEDLVKQFEIIKDMNNVRLLFLARQDDELQQTATRVFTQSSWQDLDVSYYNSDDIHSFIQTEVSTLSHQNPNAAAEAGLIVQQVSEKARGMFQWAKLVIYALGFAETRDEIFSTINHFPKKLNEAYTNTFNRLSQGPRFNSDVAILVLKVLSAAYRSLTWQELAMAVKLQQKIDEIRDVNPESLQACINFAEKEVKILKETKGPNYFSFLGPLLDIRYTSKPAGTAPDTGLTIAQPTTVITMCHHSLQQWIDGSESLVDRNSEVWKQYHFTRTEAHHALASLSLVMLSSRSVSSEYLQTYYDAENADPLVNYSGEYAFAHIRATGASAPLCRMNTRRELDGSRSKAILFDVAKMMLRNHIDITAGACAALSQSLSEINMAAVRHLPKVIALRKLKSALLPASKNLLQMSSDFEDYFRTIREMMMAREVHNEGDTNLGALLQNTALGPKLDSNKALLVLKSTDTWMALQQKVPSRQKKLWSAQVKLFCETSRHLRQLAILLSVDPVRAWIYAQVGETGIAPLVALTHASEGIDTLLAASLLPREILRKYDVAAQFNAGSDHLYYGHITATSHELSTKGYNGFDITFYKDNIMPHYRISKWEWAGTRMILAAMEMTASNPYHMNTMLKMWIVENGLYAQDAGDIIGAINIVDNVPFQEMSTRLLTLRDRAVVLVEVGFVYCFKYLTHVYPPIEDAFLDARWLIFQAKNIVVPTLRSIFSSPTDFVIAFVFYVLRNRYAPWIFANPRSSPIIDLRGIFSDPKSYTPVMGLEGWPLPPGWISLFVFMFQEMGFWFWIMFDSFDLSKEKEDQELQRRASFRIDWNNTDKYSMARKWKNAFKSHAPAWFATFRRIICIEKLFLYSTYWVFDMIRSSAELLLSKLWNWTEAMGYAVKMGGFVYTRTAGVVGGLKILARIYFWSWVFARYKETSLAGLTYQYVLRPASQKVLHASSGLLQFLVHKRDALASIMDLVEAFVIRGFQHLDFRTAVFCTATGLCVLGYVFWYMSTDPLGLQSAARSCEEAGRAAKKAAGISDPKGFLGWRSDSMDPVMIAFRDQLVELDREL